MIILATAFAGVVFRILNALLFQQLLDAPVIFAGWLVLGGLLGLVLRVLLRRPDPQAVVLARHDDWTALILPAFALVLVFLFHNGYRGVVSDARDYFVQARSIVVDGDLRISLEELQLSGARGEARIYPIGTALLWVPFLAFCHLYLGVLNGLGGEHIRNGYASPYGVAVGLGTLTYGVLALVMITRVLRTYFSARLSALATLTVCCGSFLLWYLTVEPAMTHGASLFAVTLFLYLWHETRDSRSTRQWIALGAAAGLMSIVRWQDLLFSSVLVLEAGTDYWRAWHRSSAIRLFELLRRQMAGAAAGLAMVIPQLWLWHRNSAGGPVATLTRQYGVRWLAPYPSNVLFSPNHGLLAWTPIVYLALLGLVPFMKREPRVGFALTLGFLGQLYANSAVEQWWGGSGFGARRFAGCALVFAIGLASFIEWCRARPLASVGVILTSLVAVNLFLMQDIRTGRLPSGEGLTAGQVFSLERVGNPFSFPANLLFSLTHGVPAARYDQLGRNVYANVRIDLGEPDDDMFLTYGWSGRERQPALSFRWAVGGVSGLAIPIRRPLPYILRFVAAPFMYPKAPDAFVDVLVNGSEVAHIALEERLREYLVPVDRNLLQANLNHIRFRFSRVASPQSLGMSADARELTVLFDRIEFVRR